MEIDGDIPYQVYVYHIILFIASSISLYFLLQKSFLVNNLSFRHLLMLDKPKDIKLEFRRKPNLI